MKAGVINTKAKPNGICLALYLDNATVIGAVHASSMQIQLMEIAKVYPAIHITEGKYGDVSSTD